MSVYENNTYIEIIGTEHVYTSVGELETVILTETGPPGPQGAGVVVNYSEIDQAYNPRPGNDPVVFVGPVNPDDLGVMEDNDAWINTEVVGENSYPSTAEIQAAVDAVPQVEADRVAAEAAAASIPSMPVLAKNLAHSGNTNLVGLQNMQIVSGLSWSSDEDGRGYQAESSQIWTNSALPRFTVGSLSPNYEIPASPGEVFNISVKAKSGVDGKPLWVGCYFVASNANTIAEPRPVSGKIIPPNGSHAELFLTTPPAPVGTVRVLFEVRLDSSVTPAQTGDLLTISDLVITRGAKSSFFNGSTPGARWTGTPHASTSELLMVRPEDEFDRKIGPRSTGQRLIPDLAQTSGWKFSTALYLEGVGFPEGVVTAPVGSIYIDTAATNGAIEWTKFSGTGNTGWVVTKGDTGWRDITPLLGANWVATTMAVSRKNDEAFLAVDSATGNASSAFNMPHGFRGPVRRSNIVVAGTSGVSSTAVSRVYPSSSGAVWFGSMVDADFQISWDTTDVWPSTLPGTAA